MMKEIKLSLELFNENVKKLQGYPYIFDLNLLNEIPCAVRLTYDEDTANFELQCKDGENVRKFAKTDIDSLYSEDELPILLKNEFDYEIIKFLALNLRPSKNYGADNRLYLFYESAEIFKTFLSAYNVADLISQENLVFICGAKQLENFYPLNDAQENFSKTRVQISEIKKLIFHWQCTGGFSGNSFIDGIIDFHPNLLTIKDFGLSAFGILYKEVLKNKNVSAGIQSLKNLKDDLQRQFLYQDFNDIFSDTVISGIEPVVPAKETFFEELEKVLKSYDIPTKVDWFKAMFLAYNYAMGRNFPSRIAPAIFFDLHPWHVSVVECKKEMLDIYEKFPDLKVLSTLRSPLSQFGAGLKGMHFLTKNQDLVGAGTSSYIFLKYIEIVLSRTDLYISPDDKWFYKRAVVRFEDLKLYPKETLKKLCEFLMIPCDKSLFNVTSNGGGTVYDAGYSQTTGFDTKPVYDLHKDYAGLFDFYRLEILKGTYYEPWGYHAKYYDGMNFTDEEIIKLFSLPFKCEEYCTTEELKTANAKSRDKIYEIIPKLHADPIPKCEDGTHKIPVKWLKPDVDDDKLFS